MSNVAVAETASSLRALAEQSAAWPFEEARKLVARLKRKPKDEVIFATGYGPSGLPHIGTFGGVARTTLARPARPPAPLPVRGGRPHPHGPPRHPRALRRQDQDPSDRLLGRHGRLAQG